MLRKGFNILIIIISMGVSSNVRSDNNVEISKDAIDLLIENGYEKEIAQSKALVIDPNILALLIETIAWYYNNIDAILSMLQESFSSTRAKLASMKQRTSTISSVSNSLNKEKIKSDFGMGEKGVVSYNGYTFRISDIAPSGCMRESQEWAQHSINESTNTTNGILDYLYNSIFVFNSEQINDSELYLNALGGTSKPIFLSDAKNTSSASRLASSIKILINPKTFVFNTPNKERSLSSERQSKILLVQQSMKLLIDIAVSLNEFNMKNDDGVSREDIESRVYAKSISENKVLSSGVKNYIGNYKEANETLSDLLAKQIEAHSMLKLQLQAQAIKSRDTNY